MSGGLAQPNDSPSASAYWGTATPAHAIQKAIAVIAFAEPATSLTVKRALDAVRSEAKNQGLLKEDPLNSVTFELRPGAKPKAITDDKTGASFQSVRGDHIVEAFNVASDGIRLETGVYTRWIGFKEKFQSLLKPCLPIVASSVPVRQVSVEYIDFFYSKYEGDADASLILDKKSGLISARSYSRRYPFHCHNGWFERKSEHSRYLINVDVGVADANGPPGIRRSITIRTMEAEQVIDPLGSRAAELTDLAALMVCLDDLHVRLKSRLADVLTRDARTMISLGR